MFSEEQSFRKVAWIMVLMGVTFVASMTPLVMDLQKIGEDSSDGREMLIVVLVIMLISFTAVMVLFMGSSLQLRIDGHMLQYRFKPVVNQWRTIRPEEIKRWEVRKYSAIRESGGWGIRYSLRKGTTAYTIAGKHVLDLELSDGKHILIGTGKPDELEVAMRKMMEKEE